MPDTTQHARRPARSVLPALAAGLLLSGLGGLGLAHSLRAARAQADYYKARWGAFKDEAEDIVYLCEDAHALYPFNYLFVIHAAEKAYYTAGATPDPRRRAWLLEQADTWCTRGLRLNPYKSQLRRLHTRLQARTSPAAAAAYWSAFVDWQYWVPYNHAVLVELYAAAGDLERAEAVLQVIEGRAHYADGLRAIREAWERSEGLRPPGNPLAGP